MEEDEYGNEYDTVNGLLNDPAPDNDPPEEQKQEEAAAVDSAVSPVAETAAAAAPAVTAAAVAGQETKPTATATDKRRKAFEEAGYTPEQTDALFNYDPSKGPYLSFFNQNLKKPEPLSQDRENRMRMLGTLGDSLGILSQLYGASKGAHVSKTNPESGATRYLDKYIQSLKNIYDNKLNHYNAQLLNAGYHDIGHGNTLRKEINDVYIKQRKNEIDKAKQDLERDKHTLENSLKTAKDTREKDKLQADLKKIDAEIVRLDRTGRASLISAGANATRAKAYKEHIEKGGGSASGKKPDYDVYERSAEARNDEEYKKTLPDSMMEIKHNEFGTETGRTPTKNDKLLAAHYTLWLEKKKKEAGGGTAKKQEAGGDGKKAPSGTATQEEDTEINGIYVPKHDYEEIANLKNISGEKNTAIRNIGNYLRQQQYSIEESERILDALF